MTVTPQQDYLSQASSGAFGSEAQALAQRKIVSDASTGAYGSAAADLAKPVIQTTTAQRAQTQANVQKFNTLQSQMSPASVPAGTPTGTPAAATSSTPAQPTPQPAQPSTVNIVRDIQNVDGTRTITYDDGSTSRVQVTKNQDGTESYAEVPGTPASPESALRSQIDEIKSRGQEQIQWAQNSLASLRASSSAATNAMISEIESVYGERITAMEKTNEQLLKEKTQEGLRTGSGASAGSARYTPGVYQGVLTDEEIQGNKRITALKAAMLAAMQKATAAQQEGDTKAFNDTFDMIQRIQSATDNEVSNLYNLAIKEQQMRLDEEQNAITNARNAMKDAADLSKRAAPAIAAELQKLSSQEEKDALINAFARQEGIDPSILRGDIEGALADIRKEAAGTAKDQRDAEYQKLQMENIRSEIRKRDTTPTPTTKNDVYVALNNFIASPRDSEGMPITQKDGDFTYFTKGGFKKALALARENGVLRQDFISEYVDLLSPYGLANYGLTKAEIDAITHTGAVSASKSTRDYSSADFTPTPQ